VSTKLTVAGEADEVPPCVWKAASVVAPGGTGLAHDSDKFGGHVIKVPPLCEVWTAEMPPLSESS